MPLIALLGLILSAIKISMELAAWLRDHPEISMSVRDALTRAEYTLGEVHTDLRSSVWGKHHDPEAP